MHENMTKFNLPPPIQTLKFLSGYIPDILVLYAAIMCIPQQGASMKYVTLQGRGWRRCDSLWQGRGQDRLTSHL